MSLLDEPPRQTFARFLDALSGVGIGDVADIAEIATVSVASVKYLRGSREKRAELRALRELEQYWYSTLESGEPDYGVYDSPLYLAEAWCCWAVYSRAYLRAVASSGILDAIEAVDVVVDLGCGIGLTTAALSELVPEARVIGTNLPTSLQTKVATRFQRDYKFEIQSAATTRADVVFASEYFEHFEEPVEHLREIIDVTWPRLLIVANTFGAASTGHFPAYRVEGELVSGRATSRRFADELRHRGYRRVETGFWNNRPAVWEYAP